jgi:hypothetical protein
MSFATRRCQCGQTSKQPALDVVIAEVKSQEVIADNFFSGYKRSWLFSSEYQSAFKENT